MPVIREYQSQTRAPGAVNSPQYNADQFGAASGRALEQVGSAVSGIGEAMAKREDQQNTSDVTAKLTKVNADLSIKLQNVIRTAQPGDTKPFEDYQKEADEAIGAVGDDAKSQSARVFFTENSAKIKGNLSKVSAEGQAELAGIKAVTDYTQTQNNLTTATTADPSSLQMQRDLHSAAIENLVQTGQLPREKAIKLQQQGDEQLSKAAIRGWTNLNPDYAKEKLKSGEFNSTLGTDGTKQMLGEIDQAVRAKEIEEERRVKEQEKVVKMQQQKTQNGFLQKLTDGQLSTKDILNSNLEAFGSGSKEQFLQLAKMRNSSEERLKDDASVVTGVFARIHLPDGDPNKITNDNDLNQYFGKGMSMATLNKMRDEIQGQNTEQGKIEADMKKQVMEIARGKLTKSNPLTGFRDPIGDEQMARFQSYFLEEYSKQKGAGKDYKALLNPDSPDYLGKQITQYTRTPQQMLKDMVPKKTAPADGGLAVTPGLTPADAATPGVFKAPVKQSSPRKDGESAADYLKRIKAGG